MYGGKGSLIRKKIVKKIISCDMYLHAACTIFDIRLITEKFNLQTYFSIFTATNTYLYNSDN